jgi:hypothetical protein
MENKKTNILLKRIAVALERIAESLEMHFDHTLENETSTILSEEKTSDKDENVEKSHLQEENYSINEIEHFLNNRNIKIKTVPLEEPADKVLNSLADFLGKNYDGLQELLTKIKREMNQGGLITLSMKNYAQKDINNVCQFSTRLHEIAFLEQYKYFKSPRYLIQAKTTTLPTAQNFFSGQWLERFVLLSVQRAVNTVSTELSKNLRFTYLLNPQVMLPNGDDFELDLIFHINSSFFWVEAKSGSYQQHINKYSKISKLMNLDENHSIMVLTDISPEKSLELTSLFSMTVLPLLQFEQSLIKTIMTEQKERI